MPSTRVAQRICVAMLLCATPAASQSAPARASAAASPAFQADTQRMGGLTRRFETTASREMHRLAEQSSGAAPDAIRSLEDAAHAWISRERDAFSRKDAAAFQPCSDPGAIVLIDVAGTSHACGAVQRHMRDRMQEMQDGAMRVRMEERETPIVTVDGHPIATSADTPTTARARPAYLFVWAGGRGSSEFLATIDANPASATYGRVLSVAPTGTMGYPHHTEHEVPADGHLLANDFQAGRTWLFDVRDPLHLAILGTFGDVAGFSHPHTFVRMSDGRVLATFQYRGDDGARAMRDHGAMSGMGPHATGGLVEMDERGVPVRSGSAADSSIPDRLIFPYSVLMLPGADRALSTTTDMDHADTVATSEWIQLWRLSDLKLLRSVALPPGPRGDENRLTGEARLLPDGHSIYVHTFQCGLYLVRGVEDDRPVAAFVHGFEGEDCGVPVLTGHYWLQTVPAMHGVVVLDVVDPEHPREVSRVSVGDDEAPHWIAIDHTGRRVVLNSGGRGNRLFILDFDPATGAITVDQRFRDAGSGRAGIALTGSNWPSGFVGNVVPHGAVFSR